ncbi:hypothetical protein TSMEX_006885 [Taenia solium]|eukprot:TsM_000497300 transcript=TsM_000497300 gene=TsM_000497300
MKLSVQKVFLGFHWFQSAYFSVRLTLHDTIFVFIFRPLEGVH